MRPRHQIREQLYRVGDHDSDQLRELQLEVLLDIRDLLAKLAPNGEIIVDLVPPDYGREDKL